MDKSKIIVVIIYIWFCSFEPKFIFYSDVWKYNEFIDYALVIHKHYSYSFNMLIYFKKQKEIYTLCFLCFIICVSAHLSSNYYCLILLSFFSSKQFSSSICDPGNVASFCTVVERSTNKQQENTNSLSVINFSSTPASPTDETPKSPCFNQIIESESIIHSHSRFYIYLTLSSCYYPKFLSNYSTLINSTEKLIFTCIIIVMDNFYK